MHKPQSMCVFAYYLYSTRFCRFQNNIQKQSQLLLLLLPLEWFIFIRTPKLQSFKVYLKFVARLTITLEMVLLSRVRCKFSLFLDLFRENFYGRLDFLTKRKLNAWLTVGARNDALFYFFGCCCCCSFYKNKTRKKYCHSGHCTPIRPPLLCVYEHNV